MWAILSCALRSPGVLEVIHSNQMAATCLRKLCRLQLGGLRHWVVDTNQCMQTRDGSRRSSHSQTGEDEVQASWSLQVWCRCRCCSPAPQAHSRQRDGQALSCPVLPCAVQPPTLLAALHPNHTCLHHTTPHPPSTLAPPTIRPAVRGASIHTPSPPPACLPSCPARPFSPSRSLAHLRLVCYSLNHTLSAYSSPSRYSRISDSTSACLLTSRAANFSQLAPPSSSPSPAAQPTTPTTATTRGTQHQQSVTG